MSDDDLTETVGESTLHPEAINLVPISVVDPIADATSQITGSPDTTLSVQGSPLTMLEIEHPQKYDHWPSIYMYREPNKQEYDIDGQRGPFFDTLYENMPYVKLVMDGIILSGLPIDFGPLVAIKISHSSTI